jgi:hypothetical protein
VIRPKVVQKVRCHPTAEDDDDEGRDDDGGGDDEVPDDDVEVVQEHCEGADADGEVHVDAAAAASNSPVPEPDHVRNRADHDHGPPYHEFYLSHVPVPACCLYPDHEHRLFLHAYSSTHTQDLAYYQSGELRVFFHLLPILLVSRWDHRRQHGLVKSVG